MVAEHMLQGSTALHKAAGNGHAGCVRILLRSGAKSTEIRSILCWLADKVPVNARNFGAETPRDVAVRFGHDACAALLGTKHG